MKRTKDGGALVEFTDGKVERLNIEEFERTRAIRNLIRVSVITGTIIIETVIGSSYLVTLGVTFVMIGWRLSTGW
ncbi:hypothetical protein LCGC14_0477930 [marine sediment metagenome]|uniref:Uncharacterized protein n=1 Tax=marine sediment metagenome TaxID=412755 RepID=A0A0F9STD6_9ZZZZ